MIPRKPVPCPKCGLVVMPVKPDERDKVPPRCPACGKQVHADEVKPE